MSWGGGSGGRPELFTGSKLYISEKSLCWMKNCNSIKNCCYCTVTIQ